MYMKTDKEKNVFAWYMYDWANSAFATTVIAAILPIYFATVIVPPDGWVFRFVGIVIPTNATTLWAFLSGTTALLVFLTAPILGAIADISESKKKFLMAFCFGGSLFTILLYLCQDGDVWMTMVFFFLANTCFISANIFYDSFLPHIASRREIDQVSGRGYAYGYMGGGLQFLICLILILAHEKIGIEKTLAVRISLLFSGTWWAGFSIITFVWLREPGSSKTSPQQYPGKINSWTYLRIGILQTWNTILSVKKYRNLALFLIAFMFYNDGIQTVIRMAAIYGKDELELKNQTLMGTLLLVQFIGIGGALLFSRIAKTFGSKRILIFVLFLWLGILCYAYLMTGALDFWILGMAVGLVLGGSQAISRSLYGSMVPADESAEFFGFYSVFEKFSAIWGPFVFGIIRQVTGTSRIAILSLVGFFIIGIICLCFVKEKDINTQG
ncbi:MAG: MFS transporter [Planctomycetes bacterium RIFCSPLOWO2_12_FULL_40_19]|nr:MAG: MFS transporter [Planctomycetes bacterium RIFCSPLOWO2_12_FULL_40_19]